MHYDLTKETGKKTIRNPALLSNSPYINESWSSCKPFELILKTELFVFQKMSCKTISYAQLIFKFSVVNGIGS